MKAKDLVQTEVGCYREGTGGPNRPVPPSRRGLVLIGVLWLLTILTVMVTVMARESSMERRLSLADNESQRAHWAMHAGVERAIALLNDDFKDSDSQYDIWWNNPADCNDIDLGGCYLSFVIRDETGKLNINTINKRQLMTLPNMTDIIADSILDWRDRNDELRANGAESGYYRNLKPGYEVRNGPFRTVRDLLLVRDVTPELLYGEDWNTNGKLDPAENDGDRLPPLDNEDGILDRGWFDHLTCYSYATDTDAAGSQRININQASEEELTAQLGIKPSYAKWIVNERDNGFDSIGDLINNNSPRQPRDRDTDEAEPMDLQTFAAIVDRITVSQGQGQRRSALVNLNTASETALACVLEGDWAMAKSLVQWRDSRGAGVYSIGQLLQIEGMNVNRFKRVVDRLTTRSNVFGVQCRVTSMKTGALYRGEFVVDRGGDPEAILYHYEGAY